MIKNIDTDKITSIVKEAGKIIMNYYNIGDLNVHLKEDKSPVTSADIEANELICSALNDLYPSIPIISEESLNDLNQTNKEFWLIDPLDGTKSFIKHNGAFTVNIGLIINSSPVLGFVYAPLSDECFYVDNNYIAYKQVGNSTPYPIKVSRLPHEGLTIVTSKTGSDNYKFKEYLKGISAKRINFVSSSLKICMIAEGSADLYPRFGRTMEWDTAAAHAVLKAAGGNITNLNGEELLYGKNKLEYYNPEFIASNHK